VKPQLPATLDEAAYAIEYARKLFAALKENKVDVPGATETRLFHAAESRRLVVHVLKSCAMSETKQMMLIVSEARAGSGLAQDAMQELLLELHNRGIQPPTYLAAYAMELIKDGPSPRKTGPNEADRFVRNVAIIAVVRDVAQKFGLYWTRNPASLSRPCACWIVAEALGMSESAVVAICQDYRRGRPLFPVL
jgi:hypothetical protein